MSLCTDVVRVFRDLGCTTAFGIPGIHNLSIYQALFEFEMDVVSVRHEQSAAFMADGYARVSGKPAICTVVDGPGILNAATGIAQARADSVPMVVIVPYGVSNSEGRLHELYAQEATAKGIGRYHVRLTSNSDFPELESQLNSFYRTGRKGPLIVEVPLSDDDEMNVDNELNVSFQERPDPTGDLTLAKQLLQESESPIVIAGGGAIGAQKELLTFVEALDSPVLNTVNAKGILPINHKLRVGFSPSLPELRAAIEGSDLTVAIGTELGETDFNFLGLADELKVQKLLRIDVDPVQITKNLKPDCSIVGFAKDVLPRLTPNSRNRSGTKRTRTLQSSARTSPFCVKPFKEFLDTLRDSCDVVVGDSTQPTYFATWLYEPTQPRKYFHSATGFGTLGYAIPASIGAKTHSREIRVVSLTGDGGSHFTAPEIQTATQLGLGIPFLIWNNSAYKEIDKAVLAQTEDHWYESPIPPDFQNLAMAYGTHYANPKNLTSLQSALENAFDRKVPTIVELSEEKFWPGDSFINWF